MTTEEQPHSAAVLASLSLLIGVLSFMAMAGGMIHGTLQNTRGAVATMMLMMVPVCTLGMMLAIIALIWRNENKRLAQAGLWINAMLAFAAFPVMTMWLLGM